MSSNDTVFRLQCRFAHIKGYARAWFITHLVPRKSRLKMLSSYIDNKLDKINHEIDVGTADVDERSAIKKAVAGILSKLFYR